MWLAACACIGWSIGNAVVIYVCTRIAGWRQRRAGKRANDALARALHEAEQRIKNAPKVPERETWHFTVGGSA